MAGPTGARAGRALRALALVTVAGLGIGAWSPAAGSPSTGSGLQTAPSIRWTPALAETATAVGQLRAAVPLGFDTVAGRADAAAAEAAAAAAVAAAVAAPPRSAGPPGAGRAGSPRPAAPVAPPSSSGLPLGIDPGGSAQVVTVVAASSRSTTAQVTAWQRGPSGWTVALGPVSARIGSGGVGQASESSTRTPAGTFGLTEAFGRAPDPGTRLPYRVVDGDDWWVSDVTSPGYNQYAQCAPGSCDFDEAASENLYAVGPVYDRAVVIDYNRGGTPGAGSAFFLHVGNGAPTAGCVAIDAGGLAALLRWLDPAASPRIAIGVG